MNLENLNVTVLNMQEVREVEGGNWFWPIITIATAAYNFYEGMIDGVQASQEAYQNQQCQ